MSSNDRDHIPAAALGRFSWKRPITSYTRVHYWVSRWITPVTRNKAWLVRKRRWDGLEYLNVGCGYGLYEGFVNMDIVWKPGVLVWDISTIAHTPLPFADATFKGIYTEHCLEHIELDEARANMREWHRVLKPGGSVRVIVPDAAIYINGWIASREGRYVELPYALEHAEATPMMSINRVSRDAHKYLYDYDTLALLLREAGFPEVRQCAFGQGRDPMLLKDSKSREWESLYVEATK
ncbi:MAG: methyltransferase domain-containing protein [Flavobacteriales bacterium]|nr:methyltransferase domain-containing protein [Flavobacteriales bacterium]